MVRKTSAPSRSPSEIVAASFAGDRLSAEGLSARYDAMMRWEWEGGAIDRDESQADTPPQSEGSSKKPSGDAIP